MLRHGMFREGALESNKPALSGASKLEMAALFGL